MWNEKYPASNQSSANRTFEEQRESSNYSPNHAQTNRGKLGFLNAQTASRTNPNEPARDHYLASSRNNMRDRRKCLDARKQRLKPPAKPSQTPTRIPHFILCRDSGSSSLTSTIGKGGEVRGGLGAGPRGGRRRRGGGAAEGAEAWALAQRRPRGGGRPRGPRARAWEAPGREREAAACEIGTGRIPRSAAAVAE
jgi:hypothetical protein